MIHHALPLLEGPLTLERVAVLAFSALAGCLPLRVVYLLYFHPLASFRGPRWAALSRFWLYSVSKTGHQEALLEELHRKYSKSHEILVT